MRISLEGCVSRPHTIAPLLACAAALLAGSASTNAQSIIDIGALDASHAFAGANAVSADGSVVAGMSAVEFWNQTRSFRRTSGGLTDLGGFADARNVIATSVSADGTWLGGTCYTSQSAVPFRWSEATGMQDLGAVSGPAFSGDVTGISADGSALVGAGRDGFAFRWTVADGVQSLSALDGGGYSYASAISADSRAVTGFSGTGTGELAFVWTEAGGMQALPQIGPDEYSAGLAISADASVVAGYDGLFAARWVNGAGSTLGTAPGGSFSVAYAISGDGQVIGGASDNATGDIVATIWTESLGMVDLNTYLPSVGVDLSGWYLMTTTGISFDGTTIVGAGIYNGVERGWVVTVPAPGALGLLSVAGIVGVRRRRAANTTGVGGHADLRGMGERRM